MVLYENLSYRPPGTARHPAKNAPKHSGSPASFICGVEMRGPQPQIRTAEKKSLNANDHAASAHSDRGDKND
jgi:hypothetical protein